MSAWKNFEKSVAKIFGTLRNPFSGSNGGISASDSVHDFIYIECKQHQHNAAVTLMKDTEKLAKAENKIPLLAFGDPNDDEKEVYVMCNIKDLCKVLEHIDLHKVNKKIPYNTNIYKLMQSTSTESRSLSEVKEQIAIEMKQIIRNKIISTNIIEDIENLGALSYFITTLQDYLSDDSEEQQEDVTNIEVEQGEDNE